jgi:hypothetical protein
LDDGASSTEIDRPENNSDLNGEKAVKTFAVSRCVCFGKIRWWQTGPNHRGNNQLVLSAFNVFGPVAGLLQTVKSKCCPRHLREANARWKGAQMQHCATGPARA